MKKEPQDVALIMLGTQPVQEPEVAVIAPCLLVLDSGGVAKQMRQAFLLPESSQFFGIIALAPVADQNTFTYCL